MSRAHESIRFPRGRVSFAFATVPPCSSTRSVASSPRRLACERCVSERVDEGEERAHPDLRPEERADNRGEGDGDEDDELRCGRVSTDKASTRGSSASWRSWERARE